LDAIDKGYGINKSMLGDGTNTPVKRRTDANIPYDAVPGGQKSDPTSSPIDWFLPFFPKVRIPGQNIPLPTNLVNIPVREAIPSIPNPVLNATKGLKGTRVTSKLVTPKGAGAPKPYRSYKPFEEGGMIDEPIGEDGMEIEGNEGIDTNYREIQGTPVALTKGETVSGLNSSEPYV
jgi:hypothetical protein